ncbi:MAG: integrase core domain-containing protein [Solimonas sp.]
MPLLQRSGRLEAAGNRCPPKQWRPADALAIQQVRRQQARSDEPQGYVFTSLAEVRRMTEDWRHRYNHHRPHRSLGGLPPVRFAMAQSTATSTSE